MPCSSFVVSGDSATGLRAETGSGTWHPDVWIGPSPACAGAPAGETRYKAALSLGLTLAPVSTIPARQARAFRVIDNRTSEMTSWDHDLLPHALAGLYDLDVFAFDDILPPAATAGKTDPDDIPETPKNPVSRVGDIWTLGKHRLMCGDATKPEHRVGCSTPRVHFLLS